MMGSNQTRAIRLPVSIGASASARRAGSILHVLATLLAVAGLVVSEASATAITFKLDCPVGAPNFPVSAGHASVQMVPMNNGQVGNPNLFYGFYPAGRNIFGGAGVIKNDKNRAMDFQISFAVTAAQYNAAAAVINADIAAPPAYHLGNFNCVDWINKVAGAAGLALPAFANRAGISDPNALWTSLDNLGNGGAFGGGTVTELAFNGSGLAPQDYSYVGTELDGHSDPFALAATMGLTGDINILGGFDVQVNDLFDLEVFNALPSEALISVDWGDGSVFDAQATSFSHAYAPGNYNAHVLVVDHGAVHSYSLEVNVADGLTTDMAEITVSDFGPATGENETDFADGTSLLAEVPEPSAAILMSLVALFVLNRPRYC